MLDIQSSMEDTVYEGKFLRIKKKDGWEFAERTSTKAAVVIAAFTSDMEIVLVEQHRIPVERSVIELPAGIVDKPEEDIVDTARRELTEETGFTCKTMNLMTFGPSSPGLTNEIVYFFLATDLRKVDDGGGVDGEKITVHLVRLNNLFAWLDEQKKQDKMVDPKLYSALLLSKRQNLFIW